MVTEILNKLVLNKLMVVAVYVIQLSAIAFVGLIIAGIIIGFGNLPLFFGVSYFWVLFFLGGISLAIFVPPAVVAIQEVLDSHSG